MRRSPPVQLIPLRFELKDHRRQDRHPRRLQGQGHDRRLLGDLVPPLPQGDPPLRGNLYKEVQGQGPGDRRHQLQREGVAEAEVKETIKDVRQGNKIDYTLRHRTTRRPRRRSPTSGLPHDPVPRPTGKVRMKLVGYTPRPSSTRSSSTLLAESRSRRERRPKLATPTGVRNRERSGRRAAPGTESSSSNRVSGPIPDSD